MTKIRGFELVSTYTNQDLLPKRETAHAAGYDLKVAERTVIAPGEIVLVPTGVKAYMQAGEVLYLYDRSSNPRKKGLVLINSVGVIDGDYYGNPGNEGHIFAQMKNITDQPVTLEVGERIVQGVFMPFLIVDGDEADGVRTGGFGSTGKQRKNMADYLLVVDMQSDYVAVGKAYHEELTAAVNDKIASYPSDRVIYILNRFFWERKDRKKKFATGLLLVSSRIFEKRRASCFTNPDLKDFLEGNGAKSIEFIGVDGNGCVKASVLAAVKENYQVSVDLSAVGVANQKKFKKTLHKWHSVGVIV